MKSQETIYREITLWDNTKGYHKETIFCYTSVKLSDIEAELIDYDFYTNSRLSLELVP